MYRASSKMKSILMILVVTSVRSTSATTLYDLAQGRQAAQSSTLRDANLAIRGKTWPRDIDTCSATEDTDNDPWWQVDLGTEREVSRVFVQGHEYDYSKRRKLENFNIFVSNLPASENGLPTKSRLCHANTNKLTNEKMGKFKCAEPIKGRYVIITSPAKFGKLELCGVHVYEECKTGDCKIDTCMDLSSPKRCALAALRGCQDYSFLKSSEQCRATCKLCKPESGIPKGLSSESDVIGKTIEMTGPATSTRDDAASEVTCPEGYFVVQCRCSSQVDCDSNMVIGNNTCRVTHTHGRPVVKPIATCQSLYTYRVVRTTTFSRTPKISCPEGLVVRSCGLYNPWAYNDKSMRAKKSGVNTCVASSRCTARLGCMIQAICVDPRIIQ